MALLKAMHFIAGYNDVASVINGKINYLSTMVVWKFYLKVALVLSITKEITRIFFMTI